MGGPFLCRIRRVGCPWRQVFLRLRPANAEASGLVFTSQKGTPLHPENVLKRAIHPACERLGPPKVGWHGLRYTSATLLHEHEPLRAAQTILEHSDLQTTLGYANVLPAWQRHAVERLEHMILFPNVPKSNEEGLGQNEQALVG